MLKRLMLVPALAVGLALVGCGGADTAALACQQAGTTVDTSAKTYVDDDGAETRCADGREVENEGSGWYVED